MRSTGLLRPTFTEDLATRLSGGACIHLLSPHGQGRRRTLEDLRRCLAPSVRVAQANLRTYPHSLASMLADLGAQAGLAGTGRLEPLLDALQQHALPTLIILHNLDELHPGPDSGYDMRFFEALNGIQGRPGLSLLCVSEQMRADWPLLRLARRPLPPLAADQILAELERRQAPAAASARPGIARWIAAQPTPYTLLGQPEAWPPA